jgi:hypothetical protein
VTLDFVKSNNEEIKSNYSVPNTVPSTSNSKYFEEQLVIFESLIIEGCNQVLNTQTQENKIMPEQNNAFKIKLESSLRMRFLLYDASLMFLVLTV